MTEFEKMMNGLIFDGADQEIDAIRSRAAELLLRLNVTIQGDQRAILQQQLFGHVGESFISLLEG